MKAIVLSGTRLLIASAAIAALASCGGGGGDGGGVSVPAATTLNATNAENVAHNVAVAVLNPTGAAGGASPLSAGGQSSTPARTHFLSRFTSQIGRVKQQLQSPSAILAGLIQTFPCAISGTVTLNIADNGTSASLTFNACSDIAGETLSGSITLSNITATATSFSATETINVTVTVVGPPSTTTTTTGSLTVSETGIGTTTTTTTLSGTEIVTTQGANTERLINFSFSSVFNSVTSIFTDTISFTYASTEIGGSVTVTTPTPFQTNLANTRPHTGVMLIVGASGGRIRITVLGNETAVAPQVRIELDADNNGAFETTLDRTWAQLEA